MCGRKLIESVQTSEKVCNEVAPAKNQTQRCPICSEDIDGRLVLVCQDCGTPHHVDCWLFNGGCAIFACNGIHAEDYWETQLAGDCNEVVESASLTITLLLAFPFTIWSTIFVCDVIRGHLNRLGGAELFEALAVIGVPMYFILAFIAIGLVASSYRAFLNARITFNPQKKEVTRQWFILIGP